MPWQHLTTHPAALFTFAARCAIDVTRASFSFALPEQNIGPYRHNKPAEYAAAADAAAHQWGLKIVLMVAVVS